MMFGRYRRLVPKEQRDLIERQQLPKPNWYVGSAEGGRMDPSVQAEINALKARIRARAAERETPSGGDDA